MKSTEHCPDCGAPFAAEIAKGTCPKCLLMGGLRVLEEPALGPAGDQASSGPAPPPNTGSGTAQRFGDYELLGEIARGGMGVIFKARQASLNRLVALKLISAGALATEELVKRFKAEAEAAASLTHPNIVPVYEIGEHQGQHFFSMGLIEGPDLRAALQLRRSSQQKPQPVCDTADETPKQAARLIGTLARAVHYAHGRGVLHRDIKPSNILLDAEGQPHLTDFGLAKLVEKESSVTCADAILGTPAYMAPEQARGEPTNITTLTDVYGLGAVLYEMLTGSPPFPGGPSAQTIRRVLDEEPAPPSRANPTVDRDLETICLRCLEKTPHTRYSSAEALADDLDRWLRHEPIHARPSTRLERARKWVHRRPAVAVLMGLLGTAILLGLAGSLTQWDKRLRAQDRTERERARGQVQLALQIPGMKPRLDVLLAIPERFRHWEWGHVLRQSATSMRQFSGGASPITAVAFSHDGKRLAAGDSDGKIRVWDRDRGAVLFEHSADPPIEAIAFDGELDRILALSASGCLVAWNTASGALVSRLTPPVGWSYGQLSSNGRRLLSATGTDLVICDTAQGRSIKQQAPFPPHERGTVFSWDGQFVALASADGYCICETDTGGVVCRIRRLVPPRPVMAFSQDGRQFFGSSADNTLTLFDARTGQTLRETAILATPAQPGTGSRPRPPGGEVLCSPGGQWLATLDPQFGVNVWDGRTFEKLRRWAWDDLEPLPNAVSPDGQWIVSGTEQGLVRLWRVDPEPRPLPHAAPVTAIGLSHNETRLATGCSDGAVSLWDAGTGALLWSVRSHFQWITEVALSPDDQLIASASNDRSVRLWEAASGKELHSIVHPCSVHSAAFHPDGRRLFTAGGDGKVRIWDKLGREIQPPLALHTNAIRKMVLSRDGRWLVTGSQDRQVRILDLELGRELQPKFPRQDGPITALALNRTGTRLAVGSGKRTEVWELPSGDHPFRPRTQRYLFHFKTLADSGAVAFTPDDRRLFIAGGCGSGDRGCSQIEIWDTDDRGEVLHLEGNGRVFLAFAVTADGRRVYAGGDAGSVRVWDALPWPVAQYPGPKSEPFTERLKKFLDGGCTNMPAAALFPVDAIPMRAHPRSAWPKRDSATPCSALDLTPRYNARLDITWNPLKQPIMLPNDLASLSTGVKSFNGVSFDVRGLIQLSGETALGFDPYYPAEGKGIQVGQFCREIHFLQGAYDLKAAHGTRIASYVLHYADQTSEELPVLAGRDVADWWSDPANPTVPTAASEVWQGTNAATMKKPGSHIRLFLSTRANPHPEKQITSIDFVSARARGAPFLVAVSVE